MPDGLDESLCWFQAEGEALKIRVDEFFKEVVNKLRRFDTKHLKSLSFAKPVTEKEAPGYKDVIARPMSIKVIGCVLLLSPPPILPAIDLAAPLVAVGSRYLRLSGAPCCCIKHVVQLCGALL